MNFTQAKEQAQATTEQTGRRYYDCLQCRQDHQFATSYYYPLCYQGQASKINPCPKNKQLGFTCFVSVKFDKHAEPYIVDEIHWEK